MKRVLKLLLFISLLIQSACNYGIAELQKDKINPYSISLGRFKTYEQALKFKLKLSDSVRAHLRLESVEKERYKLFYGKYPSAYSAGEKAFELYKKSLVKDYEINRNGQRVLDEFANVPFIAYYLGKPAVFNYNVKTKSTEILWSRSNRKVLSLNVAQNAESVFIITAESMSKRNNISLIQNAMLYILHRNEDETEELMQIGNINQLYTYWDQPDTFRVNVTFPDSNNSRIIYQRIASWDSYGKKGKLTERSFDLLLQGFPVQPKRKPELLSPSGQFQIRIAKNNGRQYFYLKNFPDKSEILFTSSQGEVEDIRWSLDSRYIFIQTKVLPIQGKKNGASPGQQIIIYDTKVQKVTRILEGSGFRNLLVRGKLLFFDEHLNGANHIAIVDLAIQSRYDSINMPGGCALNSLPN
ncbi:MAG: hypothetical protein Q8L04_14815 [Ignavibacteria bacterium]|nr:hypothetical protein [Ignavibacteria bacterium]